jgi:hypothetical protein
MIGPLSPALPLGLVLVAAACNGDGPPNGWFENVADSAGIDHVQGGPETFTPEPSAIAASGGAAVADYDADGLPDIYVTRVDDTDILYRNLGDGTFEDATESAGLTLDASTNAAAWADVDNDGDLDLYVTAIEDTRYYLFVNDGEGHFAEEAVERGAAIETEEPHMGWTAGFGDFDNDGYLDLHVCERQELFGTPPRPSHTRLLRNRGAEAPGHFEDVTVDAGVVYDDFSSSRGDTASHAFVSTFTDVDEDGFADLLVSADFGTSRLFWNEGDGTFTDGTRAAGVGTEQNGMGSVVDDFDGDGRLDWFVDSVDCNGCFRFAWVGQNGNRMYRYVGDRTFEDVTDRAGVRDGRWAWGTASLDYDNDGDLDLVQTNGVRYQGQIYEPFYEDRVRFWENLGDGTFRDIAEQIGIGADVGEGRGLMVLDYDDDGDLDIFIVNHGDRASLWRNATLNDNGYCRVKLEGTTNRHGIGARVSVRAQPDGPEQLREVRASGQYLGQSEVVLHFGLGSGVETADQIRVLWPTTGREEVLRDVPCNRTVVISESETGISG